MKKEKEKKKEFFFFKQKTAYEIKECDWSSDVCSSDLLRKLPACVRRFVNTAHTNRKQKAGVM